MASFPAGVAELIAGGVATAPAPSKGGSAAEAAVADDGGRRRRAAAAAGEMDEETRRNRRTAPSDAEEAATKIQASFRGYQVRKQLNKLKVRGFYEEGKFVKKWEYSIAD